MNSSTQRQTKGFHHGGTESTEELGPKPSLCPLCLRGNRNIQHRVKVFGVWSAPANHGYDESIMSLEIARLLLGLLIAALHRPIADFMLERERSLVLAFRERSMPLPAVPNTETLRTIYFSIGIFMVVVEMLRIYQFTC